MHNDMICTMERHKWHILKELDEAKEKIFKELSITDKEVIQKIGDLIDDFCNARNELDKLVINANVHANEKMSEYRASLDTLNKEFEYNVRVALNDYIADDYTREKVRGAIVEYVADTNAGNLTLADVMQTTGDSIDDVMSQKAVTDLTCDATTVDLSLYAFGQGTLAQGWVDTTNSARCCTLEGIPIEGVSSIHFTVESGYKWVAHFYNDANYVSDTLWVETSGTADIPEGANILRVVIANVSNGAITPEEAITKVGVTLYHSKIGVIGERVNLLETVSGAEKKTIDLSLYEFINGTIYNGVYDTNTARCTTNKFIPLEGVAKLTATIQIHNYRYVASFFDRNYAWISEIAWTTSKNVPIPDNAMYMKIAVSTVNNETITPDVAINGVAFETIVSAVKVIENKLTEKENSDFAINRDKIKAFAELFNGTDKVETFLYFTDPHLCMFNGDAWRGEFEKYMRALGEYFNESATDRVFCGGDWLGNSETVAEACYRLGLIDATMCKYFKEYHNIVGNHDTNYQGEETLTNSTIRNLWYRKEGNAWYTVNGVNTKFLVVDTQTEFKAIADYENEQIEWFIAELRNNTHDNVALLPHIVFPQLNADGTIDTVHLQPLTAQLLNICEAFNNRGSITVNGTIRNFANARGRVRFVMTGHAHKDYVHTLNNIPIVVTTQLREGGSPTFDLCIADYDNNTLKLVRVGSGTDREITI